MEFDDNSIIEGFEGINNKLIWIIIILSSSLLVFFGLICIAIKLMGGI